MKPVIQKIKFTKEQQEEIDLINKGERVPTIKTIIDKKTGVKRDIVYNRHFTFESGVKRFRELYGGMCSRCGTNWPSFKIMHNVGDENQGGWLVERYCDSCYDKRKARIEWKKKKKS